METVANALLGPHWMATSSRPRSFATSAFGYADVNAVEFFIPHHRINQYKIFRRDSE
jgi:hypothetical protein